ncbi:MAG: redoxin domain-containing protein [Acidimicrobiales bacterium]|nr:redoxin domain-containing protein [Hyphomonadaceae bacterium]RZV43365.1 MAG: redoxin domain-containing protein [Acidimicrobiales bacterium]
MKFSTKATLSAVLTCATALSFSNPAMAKVVTGEAAPDVRVIDSNGVERTLSEFKGQDVVLEWTNHKCPYVVKHYDSNNMQNTQKRASEDGFAWLTVISSAPGKQGHVSGEKANKLTKKRGATPTAVLLDESGDAGRLYAAKTTPHMYIVNKQGTLVYQGAIDSIPSANPKKIAEATNYVTAALDSMKAGTAIEVTDSQPYGCSIKY